MFNTTENSRVSRNTISHVRLFPTPNQTSSLRTTERAHNAQEAAPRQTNERQPAERFPFVALLITLSPHQFSRCNCKVTGRRRTSALSDVLNCQERLDLLLNGACEVFAVYGVELHTNSDIIILTNICSSTPVIARCTSRFYN